MIARRARPWHPIRSWRLSARRAVRRLRRRLGRGDAGTTTLEWALLLAAIGIPSFAIMMIALNILVEHYRMLSQINSLPFP